MCVRRRALAVAALLASACGARTALNEQRGSSSDASANPVCVLSEPLELAGGTPRATVTLAGSAASASGVFVVWRHGSDAPQLGFVSWQLRQTLMGLAPTAPRRAWSSAPSVAVGGDRILLAGHSTQGTVDVLTATFDRTPDSRWLPIVAPQDDSVLTRFDGTDWWLILSSASRIQLNRLPNPLAPGISVETSGSLCPSPASMFLLDGAGRSFLLVCGDPRPTPTVWGLRVPHATAWPDSTHQLSAVGVPTVLLAAATSGSQFVALTVASAESPSARGESFSTETFASQRVRAEIALTRSSERSVRTVAAATPQGWIVASIYAARESAHVALRVTPVLATLESRGSPFDLVLGTMSRPTDLRVHMSGSRGIAFFAADSGSPSRARAFAARIECAE